MKLCNEALSMFIQFKTVVEVFCKESVMLLCVDNAPELIQGQMATYCKANGITYEKTVPNSPPQNGVAEHTNLTICSMAHAILIDANLHDWFWPFTVLCAVHIKQRVPHTSLPANTTPFERWFKHRPDLFHLQPFGVLCTARIIATSLSKFVPHRENS